MGSPMNTFEMADRRETSGMDPLYGFLAESQAQPVEIDVGKVENIDLLRLQMLLSAQNEWKASGHEFVLSGAQDAFSQSLAAFGFPSNIFDMKDPT